MTTLSNIGEAIAFLELLLAEMTGQHHCDVDIHSIGYVLKAMADGEIYFLIK